MPQPDIESLGESLNDLDTVTEKGESDFIDTSSFCSVSFCSEKSKMFTPPPKPVEKSKPKRKRDAKYDQKAADIGKGWRTPTKQVFDNFFTSVRTRALKQADEGQILSASHDPIPDQQNLESKNAEMRSEKDEDKCEIKEPEFKTPKKKKLRLVRTDAKPNASKNLLEDLIDSRLEKMSIADKNEAMEPEQQLGSSIFDSNAKTSASNQVSKEDIKYVNILYNSKEA